MRICVSHMTKQTINIPNTVIWVLMMIYEMTHPRTLICKKNKRWRLLCAILTLLILYRLSHNRSKLLQRFQWFHEQLFDVIRREPMCKRPFKNPKVPSKQNRQLNLKNNDGIVCVINSTRVGLPTDQSFSFSYVHSTL